MHIDMNIKSTYLLYYMHDINILLFSRFSSYLRPMPLTSTGMNFHINICMKVSIHHITHSI